ncbi:MAG TPA: nucleotidyl transferase AbiEii/AbiGii toxin family protein [Chitinophagaceae bacterium]|nr:nucleotidyl transferase AbiEii/AbiGii toxin family protein [Chitinophagaceae bacterium]
MHLEILNKEQNDLLPFIKRYSKHYYLVGGTAIALHIGHRRSIDFDLFTEDEIKSIRIKRQVAEAGFSSNVILQKVDQIHFTINSVKLTFFQFPFSIAAENYYENYFRIPDLLTLAAMKAFALGGRGKWKDYIDLYFIIKFHFGIKEICNKATQLFSGVFNPALFYKQLCYFDDISFEEHVEMMPGFEVNEKEVKDFLTDAALTGF